MMVCYDGSDAARRALEYAVGRATGQEVEVSVVYSLKAEEGTAHLYGEEIEKAKESLAAAASLLQEQGVPHRVHLLQRGLTPGEDLVVFAEENGMDEAVIGIRKRSRVGKLLMGSVAQYLILSGPCPVVSV